MANATPISADEAVAAPEVKATKKGASSAISADVLAEIKAQVREEMKATSQPQAFPAVPASESFKVPGGVQLESHAAVREDF